MCTGESVDRTSDLAFIVAAGDSFLNEPHISSDIGSLCSRHPCSHYQAGEANFCEYVFGVRLLTLSSCFGLRSRQAVISSQGFPANLEAVVLTKIGPVFPELPTSKL